jgi:drug/metabolite transporter (DMT)-like permease
MELPLLLALASALTWGAGDFLGGLATRQAKAVSTTFTSQIVGLLGLVVVCLLGAGGTIVFSDLGWGVAAGLCAVSGLGLFYESMARGAFGPVASITSVMSGAIPILAGLALGERPSTFLLGGVVVAVLAIWLIAGEKRKPGDPEHSAIANIFALGGGALFGLYFVFLSRAGNSSGLWPLAAGRSAATLALGLTIAVMRKTKSKNTAWVPQGKSFRLSASAGLLDVSANALYFYASRNGLLSVVAVLASLYPVSTIVLARVVLREKLNHRRLVGMVVGLCAVSIIAKGSVTPKGAGDITVHAQPVQPTLSSSVDSSSTTPSSLIPSTLSPSAAVNPASSPSPMPEAINTGVAGDAGHAGSAGDATTLTARSIPANNGSGDPDALALVGDELVFAEPYPVDAAEPSDPGAESETPPSRAEDSFFEKPWDSSPDYETSINP